MASNVPTETDSEPDFPADTEIDPAAPVCCGHGPLLKRLASYLWKIPLAIVCCPCAVCCFFVLDGHHYLIPGRRKLAKRRRGSGFPEPLSLRRRALTVPRGIVPVCRSAQQESLFFSKLPWEIRHVIYEHVVHPSRWNYVHVASTHKRVCSFECSENPDKPHFLHKCWKDKAADGTTIRMSKRQQDVVLGMLCSCQRMYSEAVDLLYTSNTLQICLTRTILDMQKCILPHRLQLIRSLHLDVPVSGYYMDPTSQRQIWPGSIITYWRPAWSVLAEMHGLLKLTVSVSSRMFFDNTVDRRNVTHILKPMMAVKHVQDFVLEISMPLADGILEDILQGLGGDLPFVIRLKGPIEMPVI